MEEEIEIQKREYEELSQMLQINEKSLEVPQLEIKTQLSPRSQLSPDKTAHLTNMLNLIKEERYRLY